MAYSITDTCTGCTLCAKNCPVFAITGELKHKHDINAKRCVECGVCANVCNFGAVLDSAGNVATKVPRAEWKKPVIDTELCSACGMCVQVCGKKCLAISLPKHKGDIHVYAYLANEKQCVGCGLCERVCPMHVITMD